jgi:hypothetical protein
MKFNPPSPRNMLSSTLISSSSLPLSPNTYAQLTAHGKVRAGTNKKEESSLKQSEPARFSYFKDYLELDSDD